MGILSKKIDTSGVNSHGKPKLPPGQTGTTGFPVLTYGDQPTVPPDKWQFSVWGSVEEEHQWSWQEFLALPQSRLIADFHCVTHWSRFGDEWGGVFFRDLVRQIALKPGTMHVMQHAYGGYTTNLPLQWMIEEDVMFVHTLNGEPLHPDHGGPMRVITPRRYAWKGAKWIRGLEFLVRDKPGFWEANGYSNTADPWKDERFW